MATPSSQAPSSVVASMCRKLENNWMKEMKNRIKLESKIDKLNQETTKNDKIKKMMENDDNVLKMMLTS